MTIHSSHSRSSRYSSLRKGGLLLFFLACLPLPAVAAQEQPSKAQATTDTFALYTRCSFRPQSPGCAAVYQKALTQKGPDASAVRQAFHDYARYLTPTGSGLTVTDRQFLDDSSITLPSGLTDADLAGLHNVINDPAFAANKAARQAAVNNFLSRAVEAGLYCDLGSCKNNPHTALPAGTDTTMADDNMGHQHSHS